LASAMEVRSRLWLGSMISQHRDGRLIRGLLIRVRACGPVEKILLVTDGLSSYKSQALKVFREALHTGKVGRPRLVLGTGVMIARVIKRYQRRRVVEVMRRVVAGSEAEVISRVIATAPAIDAGVDQHRLHRAPAGHLPRPAGSFGASDPRRGTQALYARSGDVAGGQLLQPLVGASLSWRGAHPGDGSRAYGSSLVDGGVVDVCGAARRSAQMAWAKAEVAAGGRGCSLTTVPCGATGNKNPLRNAGFATSCTTLQRVMDHS
jgi:hypothetical protein